MKKALLLGVLALAALVSCNKGGNDPRLVIITFDGLRWQELYGGADEALVNDSRFVGNVGALKAKYWRETAEERREALMPFLWSYAPEHGYMLGNRTKNSRMQVDNTMNFCREPGSPLQGQGDDVFLLGEHPFCHEQRPRQYSGQQRP